MAEYGSPCPKCGRSEPEVKFYRRTGDGNRFAICAKCHTDQIKRRQRVEREEDARAALEYIRHSSKSVRYRRVHALILKGALSVSEFGVLLDAGAVTTGNNHRI